MSPEGCQAAGARSASLGPGACQGWNGEEAGGGWKRRARASVRTEASTRGRCGRFLGNRPSCPGCTRPPSQVPPCPSLWGHVRDRFRGAALRVRALGCRNLQGRSRALCSGAPPREVSLTISDPCRRGKAFNFFQAVNLEAPAHCVANVFTAERGTKSGAAGAVLGYSHTPELSRFPALLQHALGALSL